MKKWILAVLFLALLAGETGCVVRVKERREPYPQPSPRSNMHY